MVDRMLTVALIFGGRSAEHEVSLRSGASVFRAMDKTRYQVMPVLITRDGAWFKRPADVSVFQPDASLSGSERLVLSQDPAHRGFLNITDAGRVTPLEIDIALPVLHGTYGEDGTIQGLLDLANIPYVGCGVLASAVGMDKVLMKWAFRANGLNVGPFFWFLRSEWRDDRNGILERSERSVFPVFVKPANLGSSVGISRVAKPSALGAAIDLAALYDRKILVEDGIAGRELEVSVLGNDKAEASLPGEVVSHSDFYDYDEKYLKDSAELVIPADLPQTACDAARRAAVTAFRAVDGSGLSRVDMFLTPDGEIIVNEINTLPGFTSISMYPKLWEATNLSYERLIDRLIELALERHQDRQNIRVDR